jgi:hypothetical protein
MRLIMNYFIIGLALLAGGASLINRTMVRRIYEKDGTSLSTFSLPHIIRREYKRRFGVDNLYRSSGILPTLILITVVFCWYRVFVK